MRGKKQIKKQSKKSEENMKQWIKMIKKTIQTRRQKS